MNLIEELAKMLFYNSDSSDYDEEWDNVESSVKDTFKEIAVDIIPIFAEFIVDLWKNNPEYSGGQFKSNILSELEKMK